MRLGPDSCEINCRHVGNICHASVSKICQSNCRVPGAAFLGKSKYHQTAEFVRLVRKGNAAPTPAAAAARAAARQGCNDERKRRDVTNLEFFTERVRNSRLQLLERYCETNQSTMSGIGIAPMTSWAEASRSTRLVRVARHEGPEMITGRVKLCFLVLSLKPSVTSPFHIYLSGPTIGA